MIKGRDFVMQLNSIGYLYVMKKVVILQLCNLYLQKKHAGG